MLDVAPLIIVLPSHINHTLGGAFPYADLPIEDPLTGSKKGLLDAADADNSFKIIYTDTAAEYWQAMPR